MMNVVGEAAVVLRADDRLRRCRTSGSCPREVAVNVEWRFGLTVGAGHGQSVAFDGDPVLLTGADLADHAVTEFADVESALGRHPDGLVSTLTGSSVR